MADRGVFPGLIQRRFDRSDRGFTRALIAKSKGAIGREEFDAARRARRREMARAGDRQVEALTEMQRGRPLKPPGKL
jgi:hypothetical protein